MPSSYALTPAEIMEVFADELAAHSGVVADTFSAGDRLIARSLLPLLEQVRPNDRLQAGVAIKAAQGEVWVHPYVFREVCSNGAIMAQTLDTRHLDLSRESSDAAAYSLREAVSACCQPQVFAESVDQIRGAAADFALSLLPMLSRLRGTLGEDLVQEVLGRFAAEKDRSRFGLMNAVTSLARDTRDPELRWQLEELGGGIAAGCAPEVPRDSGSRRCALAV